MTFFFIIPNTGSFCKVLLAVTALPPSKNEAASASSPSRYPGSKIINGGLGGRKTDFVQEIKFQWQQKLKLPTMHRFFLNSR